MRDADPESPVPVLAVDFDTLLRCSPPMPVRSNSLWPSNRSLSADSNSITTCRPLFDWRHGSRQTSCRTPTVRPPARTHRRRPRASRRSLDRRGRRRRRRRLRADTSTRCRRGRIGLITAGLSLEFGESTGGPSTRVEPCTLRRRRITCTRSTAATASTEGSSGCRDHACPAWTARRPAAAGPGPSQ